MKKIKLKEAIDLLGSASWLQTTCYHSGEVRNFSLHDSATFLSVTLSDEAGKQWCYKFDKCDNELVEVSDSSMTLVTSVDTANEAITFNLLEKKRHLDSAIPEVIQKALDYVATLDPNVDRVVFWSDTRWTFMNDYYELSKFGHLGSSGVIDVYPLEQAAAYVSEHFRLPVAFQVN